MTDIYKITEEQLIEYVKQGLSDREIAGKVGVSRRHIGYLRDVFELGSGKRQEPKPQPTKADIQWHKQDNDHDPKSSRRALSLIDAETKFRAAMGGRDYRSRNAQKTQDVPSDPAATPKR
jgi:hypothetical protein